jgi:thiol:disulfide interchange protein DsbA
MKYVRLALLMAAAIVVAPMASAFDLGKEYTLVPAQQPVQGDKILVEEFFWYGCPHCYHFEPQVKQYLKTLPSNVRFVRIPVPGGSWVPQAQAYYAFEQLGVLDKVHSASGDERRSQYYRFCDRTGHQR